MTATAILPAIESKTCIKCGETKPATTEFFPLSSDRIRGVCKVCRNAAKHKARDIREQKFPEVRNDRLLNSREYGARNSEKIKENAKIYRLENSEKIKNDLHCNYLKHIDAYKARAIEWKKNNPERRLENNRRWVLENKEKSQESSRKNKARRMNNPVTAFIENTRCLIGVSVRKGGYTKQSKTHEILGCDWTVFASHIERQFLKGMSWEKMGSEIHLDHIRPMVTATTEADVIALNHFTNLRPMWAKDNLSKGAKITHLI